MFDSSKFFNGFFGKIQPGMCRLTMNGNIAIKCSNGYRTYNDKKQRLTNVTNFCFDMGSELFFVVPTMKVSEGDIILVEGKPKYVIANRKAYIEVVDYETSEIKKIVPERHVFMGSSYCYGKIVSMFGSNFKGGKGLKKIMKMMMMSQIFGGQNGGQNGGSLNFGMGNLGQMMMMSSLFGGNSDMDFFNDMFDGLSFDTDDEETPDRCTKKSKKNVVKKVEVVEGDDTDDDEGFDEGDVDPEYDDNNESEEA